MGGRRRAAQAHLLSKHNRYEEEGMGTEECPTNVLNEDK
jgi:hypothetical protein